MVVVVVSMYQPQWSVYGPLDIDNCRLREVHSLLSKVGGVDDSTEDIENWNDDQNTKDDPDFEVSDNEVEEPVIKENMQQRKLSGTAAKLGYPNAYHHCTLLANTNKLNLGNCLSKEEVNYISNSTHSVRSPIKNLCEINRNVNTSQLISSVGYEYLRTFATELRDGGNQQIMKQRGFQLINPTEKWFPGIGNLRTEFKSWEWIYGKTPKFSVEKEIFLKDQDKEHKMVLNVQVEKGLIHNVTITMPNREQLPVVSSLQRKCYNEENLSKIINALKLASTDNIMQAINRH
ncbi:lipoyltransferase 1, mitochondrial [Bactrocera tryoni]|uniref:lipoyltransferase 1, mitochondrial n=1 Tax=Bactrocera tryoni TaxID=59916 RepID=UPI001A95781B|nr:lipoyltransferase 1, mitochondrial [Bactrocera tryoni]